MATQADPNLHACNLPQREIVPFRGQAQLDAYFSSKEYTNQITSRYGALLQISAHEDVQKPARVVLHASLRGELVDFPFITSKQYVGSDVLQETFAETEDTPPPAYYTLTHWMNVAAKENGSTTPDAPLNLINWYFAGESLSNQHLNTHLSFSILEHQFWRDVKTNNSVFFSTGLYKLDAQSCNFAKTNFDFASFDECELRNCSLRDANLRAAHFNHCTLSNIDLSGANLKDCTFEKTTIRNSDLRHLNEQQIDILKQAQDTGHLTFQECELPHSLQSHTRVMDDGVIVTLKGHRPAIDNVHRQRIHRQRGRFAETGTGYERITALQDPASPTIEGPATHDGGINTTTERDQPHR